MLMAVPITGGQVSAHFGHCEQFGLFETEDGNIKSKVYLTPPPHEPGVYPKWLKEQGAHLIIAGGMGQRAQDLFSREGIQVVFGAAVADPEELVRSYLEGKLVPGDNRCDH